MEYLQPILISGATVIALHFLNRTLGFSDKGQKADFNSEVEKEFAKKFAEFWSKLNQLQEQVFSARERLATIETSHQNTINSIEKMEKKLDALNSKLDKNLQATISFMETHLQQRENPGAKNE